jgi:hypothetical protein
MAKKQTDKKKINIKLLSGQTYLVITTEEMLQVFNALTHYVAVVKDEKERLEIIKISEDVSKAISNHSYLGDNSDEEEW